MYNTLNSFIRRCAVEINDVTLQKLYTAELSSCEMDGVCHVKSLPFLSVVQALEGEYEIQLEQGPTYRTGTGGIFLAPSRVLQTITHHADEKTGSMRSRWAFMQIVVNHSSLLDSLFEWPVLVPEEKRADFHQCLDDLFSASHPCDRMICGYRLSRLLLEAGTLKEQSPRIDFSPVERYISQYYGKKISVSVLAELMHMSESNFHLSFKKAFGVSPMAYVNQYRLSMAQLLLHNPALSLQEIAECTGFYDQFYFSRCFKQVYSLSPSRYRSELIPAQAPIPLQSPSEF